MGAFDFGISGEIKDVPRRCRFRFIVVKPRSVFELEPSDSDTVGAWARFLTVHRLTLFAILKSIG